MSNHDLGKKNQAQDLWVPDYLVHLDSMKDLLTGWRNENKKHDKN